MFHYIYIKSYIKLFTWVTWPDNKIKWKIPIQVFDVSITGATCFNDRETKCWLPGHHLLRNTHALSSWMNAWCMGIHNTPVGLLVYILCHDRWSYLAPTEIWLILLDQVINIHLFCMLIEPDYRLSQELLDQTLKCLFSVLGFSWFSFQQIVPNMSILLNNSENIWCCFEKIELAVCRSTQLILRRINWISKTICHI